MIFIQENEFENVVCNMAAILARLQCFNTDSAVLSVEISSAILSNGAQRKRIQNL